MNLKQFSLIRLALFLIIGMVILVAFITNNLYLVLFGFLIGILLIFLVRKKFKKVIIDERVESISGQASKMVYLFTTLFFSLLFIFFVLPGQKHDDHFSEALGVIFGYIAMFNISLYAIFFHYFNKKYSGDSK